MTNSIIKLYIYTRCPIKSDTLAKCPRSKQAINRNNWPAFPWEFSYYFLALYLSSTLIPLIKILPASDNIC